MSVDVSELVTSTGTDLAAARERAAEQERKAEEAKHEAEAAIAEAEAAEREGRRDASRRYTDAMRALTAEVRQCREAAEAAVRTADGPAVLSAWLTWRMTRARNKAKWEMLKDHFEGSTGQRAPRGDWGRPLVRDPDVPGKPETFDDFLTATTLAAEREAHSTGHRAASDEIKAHREATRSS